MKWAKQNIPNKKKSLRERCIMANTRGSMRAEDVVRMRVHRQRGKGGGSRETERGGAGGVFFFFFLNLLSHPTPSGTDSPLLIVKMDQSAMRLSLLPWKHIHLMLRWGMCVWGKKNRKTEKETLHVCKSVGGGGVWWEAPQRERKKISQFER